MQKIAIMGFGIEGQAMYEFLKMSTSSVDINSKQEIHVFDDNPDVVVPDGVVFHHGHTISAEFDIVYKTPGIPSHKMVLENPETKVSSLTNLFLENIKGKVIGVTGSKGKSTTASLIHHILSNAGKKSVLVGNIGTVALMKFSEDSPATWYVYEMSSFQCELLNRSPHIAVITNLYEEHLDHHGSFEKYKEAKWNITKYQNISDFLVVPEVLDIETRAKKIVAGEPIVHYRTKLLGDHNQMNIALAKAVAVIVGVGDDVIAKSVETFKPLEYRLQKIYGHQGITFYDDSLATIPEATLAAIHALGNVDTLILGGQDRGINLAGFPEALGKTGVQTFITLPENGPRMVEGIVGRNVFHAQSMEEAVRLAYQHTHLPPAHAGGVQAGGVCLLSNASPSFNLFKDYKDKSAQYRKWILELNK